MATCPCCRHHFRVLEDEDDGQHDCPRCGYTSEASRKRQREDRIEYLRDRLEQVDCPACEGAGVLDCGIYNDGYRDEPPMECPDCSGAGTRNIADTPPEFFGDRKNELYRRNHALLEELWQLQSEK
jgi:ssDNA-binding Zn-finger/Zn-ribbon topoisomerase 1